jgi:hypothetical protein
MIPHLITFEDAQKHEDLPHTLVLRSGGFLLAALCLDIHPASAGGRSSKPCPRPIEIR